MSKNKEVMKAIYDDNIEPFLKSIMKWEDVDNGKIKCIECGQIITFDNIQLIIPRVDDNFEFVCVSPDCIASYYQKGGE
jgi:hypothetical protein